MPGALLDSAESSSGEIFLREEVNLGLQNKGAKPAAKAAEASKAVCAVSGRSRRRSPKTAHPGETEPTQIEQMGLGL